MAIADLPQLQQQIRDSYTEPKENIIHSPYELPIAIGAVVLVSVLLFGKFILKRG